jgi:hypothetical protein
MSLNTKLQNIINAQIFIIDVGQQEPLMEEHEHKEKKNKIK